jgi:thioredoxin 2
MSASTGKPMAKVVVCPVCQTKNRVPSVAKGTPRCGKCHSPVPWVAEASDSDFTAVADGSTVPVVVDLWAPWCGPCLRVSPVLEQLAGEFAGQLKLVKVNVDESPNLSRRFDAQAIPTLVLLNGGKVIARQVGAAPAPALRAWLTEKLPAKT